METYKYNEEGKLVLVDKYTHPKIFNVEYFGDDEILGFYNVIIPNDLIKSDGDHFVVSKNGVIFRKHVSYINSSKYYSSRKIKSKQKRIEHEEVFLVKKDDEYYIRNRHERDGLIYHELYSVKKLLLAAYNKKIISFDEKLINIDYNKKYPFSKIDFDNAFDSAIAKAREINNKKLADGIKELCNNIKSFEGQEFAYIEYNKKVFVFSNNMKLYIVTSGKLRECEKFFDLQQRKIAYIMSYIPDEYNKNKGLFFPSTEFLKYFNENKYYEKFLKKEKSIEKNISSIDFMNLTNDTFGKFIRKVDQDDVFIIKNDGLKNSLRVYAASGMIYTVYKDRIEQNNCSRIYDGLMSYVFLDRINNKWQKNYINSREMVKLKFKDMRVWDRVRDKIKARGKYNVKVYKQ